MYSVNYTNRFKKDLKRCTKRGLDTEKLRTVINILVQNGQLPETYRPHMLTGNHHDEWECHIQPDWLLVWKQDNNLLSLLFMQTGTHADLFGK